MKFKLCTALVSTLLAASFLCCNAATLHYTVTDLGTLGGSTIYARDINNNGLVVGSATLADGRSHAFSWENNQIKDLNNPTDDYGEAVAVNNHGKIAGNTGYVWRWQAGTRTVLDQGAIFKASAINDNGDIVGGYNGHPEAYNGPGVLWDSNNVKHTINITQPIAVNNQGDVIGFNYSFYYDRDWYPVYDQWAELYHNGTYTRLDGLSGIMDINDSGQVLGYKNGCLCLYKDGQFTYLTTRPVSFYGGHINKVGQVAGYSYTPGIGNRASLYDSSLGGVVNLNTLIDPNSGWTLETATAINDNGWIVGYGTYNGQQRSFLLTPTPEPSSIFALVCGLGGLGAAIRRKRA